ncbi:MAG: hypothetical protein IIY06_03645 [Proteobacteria bacterium]|nr:hypothetical protein [Pseudomonadota bacterium]
MKRTTKRLLGVWIIGIVSMSLSGCQMIKDKVYTPEQTVVDYAEQVTKIMNSEADCEKLAQALTTYCNEREAFVTEAVKQTVQRLNNNEIDEKTLNKMRQDLEPLKNSNFTSCLLTPSVTMSKLNCLKPLSGVVSAVL